MNYEMLVWFVALLIFAGLEAGTVNLVAVWFIGGSLAALIAAMCGAPIWLQATLFFAVSILLLVRLRPFVKKYLKPNLTATNVYSNIGKVAVVTERIDNIHATGAVKLGSVVWTARSVGDGIIEPESLVTVRSIEGVKLYVEPAQVPVK